MNVYVSRSVVVIAWLINAVFCATTSGDEDSVDVSIRLHEGRYYYRNQVHQELNDKLGTNYPVRPGMDKRFELRCVDRVALTLAQAAGLLQVKTSNERLTISIRNVGDGKQVEDILAIGWGLDIPPKFDPRKQTVVLIHGLEAGPKGLRPMAQAFQSLGVQVLFFDYPNDGPLALAGDRLSENLKELAESNLGTSVVIVAHSMGGLVARYSLEMPKKNPGCVTHLFMLGTPNRGSRLASWQPHLEALSNIVPDYQPSKWTTKNDGRGEVVADLLPGSTFLGKLNRQRKPVGVAYHVGIGTKAFLSAREQREAVHAFDLLAKRLEVRKSQRTELRELLASDEIQTGKGDGAVSAASASIERADTTQSFALNHLDLISLPDKPPTEHSVFCWITETLSWRNASDLSRRQE